MRSHLTSTQSHTLWLYDYKQYDEDTFKHKLPLCFKAWTLFYIYSLPHNTQSIESFASILSRSQKLIAHTFFKIEHFFLESLCIWVYRFSRVLVGIVSWFSQEDWLGLIKASKEVNNFIQPPMDLGVFQTVLEVEGGSFTGRSIEDSSEEIEGVHG